MTLFSYCLRIDDGAAPNPFWGVCTLVICKPAIRRTARIGDWIVGLGSANSPLGDIYDHVVYMMKVTDKMSMAAYDAYCRANLPRKIPNWNSTDFMDRAGDCIYDFSVKPIPALRKSVHPEDCRKRDMSGENALLSARFYYFGDKPVQLPPHLKPIIHSTQGHKADSNAPYVVPFLAWLDSLKLRRNVLLGEPQCKDKLADHEKITCFQREAAEAEPEGDGACS